MYNDAPKELLRHIPQQALDEKPDNISRLFLETTKITNSSIAVLQLPDGLRSYGDITEYYDPARYALRIVCGTSAWRSLITTISSWFDTVLPRTRTSHQLGTVYLTATQQCCSQIFRLWWHAFRSHAYCFCLDSSVHSNATVTSMGAWSIDCFEKKTNKNEGCGQE